MAKRYISIKISGTPVRKSGFIPMVNINDAFFEINDVYQPALSRDACLYTVVTEPDATVYKLVFNRMRHHGDGSDARLVIGFSIPAGYALCGGVDPAGLLHSLLEAFVGRFAVALPDGYFEYRFGRFDTEDLERICLSTELCEASGRRVVMDPAAAKGAIEVPRDRIPGILCDTGRDDFAGISELLVAEHINMSLAGVRLPADIYTAPSAIPEAQNAVGTGMSAGTAMNNTGDTDVTDNTDDAGDNGDVLPQPSAGPAVYAGRAGEDVEEDADGTRPRRTWPVLLAGILLGAAAALVVPALLPHDKSGDKEALKPVVADTVVAAVPADTVAPVVAETVYIEKKVVVKVAPSARRSAVKTARQQPAAAQEAPVQQSVQPEPQLKYDPEAERSL